MISKSNNFKQVSVLADLPTKSSKERYIYVNLKSMFLYGRQKVVKHESAAYFVCCSYYSPTQTVPIYFLFILFSDSSMNLVFLAFKCLTITFAFLFSVAVSSHLGLPLFYSLKIQRWTYQDWVGRVVYYSVGLVSTEIHTSSANHVSPIFCCTYKHLCAIINVMWSLITVLAYLLHSFRLFLQVAMSNLCISM